MLPPSVSGIKHPAFREALALTKPAARRETGRYLVEDADLIRQALASPSPVWAVFAAEREVERLAPLCRARQAPLYLAGAGLLTKLIGTGYETAITAVAIVGQRVVAPGDLLAGGDTLVLAGERIQDPRNVGVLVRTAEAAGCAGLLLGESAEPWSRAAVRSTTGSILRLPLCLVPDLSATLADLRARCGAHVVATSARADRLVYDADLGARPLVLVVGNETEGVSAETRAASADFVRLPMAPAGASSLNVTVAAGVLLYEALRQGQPRA